LRSFQDNRICRDRVRHGNGVTELPVNPGEQIAVIGLLSP
jgi:hypothetical protein